MPRAPIDTGPFLKLYVQVFGHPTRQLKLPGRRFEPRAMLTFLGHEVQAGRKRFTCPDLPTARYISLFLRIGVSRAAIPYNPVKVAAVVGPLEDALGNLLKDATPSAGRYRLARLREQVESLNDKAPDDLPVSAPARG